MTVALCNTDPFRTGKDWTAQCWGFGKREQKHSVAPSLGELYKNNLTNSFHICPSLYCLPARFGRAGRRQEKTWRCERENTGADREAGRLRLTKTESRKQAGGNCSQGFGRERAEGVYHAPHAAVIRYTIFTALPFFLLMWVFPATLGCRAAAWDSACLAEGTRQERQCLWGKGACNGSKACKGDGAALRMERKGAPGKEEP